jgi:hypothetical protein
MLDSFMALPAYRSRARLARVLRQNDARSGLFLSLGFFECTA